VIYTLSIYILQALYNVAALFHPKAKLFVQGRKDLLNKITEAFHENSAPVLWVHCASLGEFEQGRPIIEIFKKRYPTYKVLLTFFSPSGYEVRKNYSHADFIFYLPLDTPRNARQFIEITKPALAIFIKYEFWHHFTVELRKKNITIISASSIFREDQIFFSWYGGFFKSILKRFSHFFVQNESSAALLAKIGISEVTLSGDTRFDRVYEITQQGKEIELAKKFKGSEKAFVIGSLWPEDLEILAPFINDHSKSIKFIIAPHEINERFLVQIEKSLSVKSIRFSQADKKIESYPVLLIDNIGMLSRLYRYGEFAYVGGAFGKGLHNILEAACYGIPVYFGNKNYQKFQEAKDLIMRGGAFALNDYTELKYNFELMINKPETFLLACDVTRTYVQENLGATEKIMSYCNKLLLNERAGN
jgi:3-deoxy-D-manno-octulosonic-acid transferase